VKRISAFLILAFSVSCIDPYIPSLKNYNSLLVVEGLITDENNSNIIKLCRTTDEEAAVPEMVSDADVYITDGDGVKTSLRNCMNGYYKTDSTTFKGAVGQKYTLHIFTNDGKEYESEECTMLPVAGIDKLFYEKGEEIIGTEGESFTGLKILLSPAQVPAAGQYLRWTFEEVWKSDIPFPPQNLFEYINDTSYFFKAIPNINTFCWKMDLSKEIIISSIAATGNYFPDNQEIHFIAPVKSDRLVKQYCITVKQYSISKEEYDYWNNLKIIGETGGDIFASLPYMVTSNIQNVNGTGEKVLGYFEVSAVNQKRMYITENELEQLSLPHYKTECNLIAKCPDDYPQPINSWCCPPPPTWNGIYHLFTDNGDYEFIRPEVRPGVILSGNVHKKDLVKLFFALKACTICEEPSLASMPDYWIDPE
jgi:hypothetical protein